METSTKTSTLPDGVYHAYTNFIFSKVPNHFSPVLTFGLHVSAAIVLWFGYDSAKNYIELNRRLACVFVKKSIHFTFLILWIRERFKILIYTKIFDILYL